MRIVIKKNPEEVGQCVAGYIIKRIREANPIKEKPFVLGLPTGSSPIPTYQELVRLHKAGKVSFKNVVTFNMDEYVGLPEDHPGSYHYFMYENLFKYIDIPKENIHILNGNASDLKKECHEYEEKISRFGGIDLFLGGIGSNGHIAFNELGSSLTSRTRLITLSYETKLANSRFFDNDINKVPTTALTVGVGTIMDARDVLIIITGYEKARALRHAVEEGINHMWTVSMVQMHQNATIVCDDEATMELKVKTVRYFENIEEIAAKGIPHLAE